MNILLLGSGGREHAIAFKIAQSTLCNRLFIAPGNAGTAGVGTNVDLDMADFAAMGRFVLEQHVDMLVAAGSFSNLRGLLYFTDGMGVYPTKRPGYEVAFVLLEEPPLSVKMPPWAIRIMPSLPWKKQRESFDEFWQEEVLAELPEL